MPTFFDSLLRTFLQIFRLGVRFSLWIIKGGKRGRIASIKHDSLILEPATVLAEKIRNQQIKSETVVRAYLDRIAKVNPHLNAVIDERFKEALQDAKDADKYIMTSGKTPQELAVQKPFLGVPFSSKEAIAVKGLSLTAGVLDRKGMKADQDSEAVTLMREAGAIPLCVTNVSERGSWGDSSNKVYGITNNPYDLNRIPGGSSGGEAALISAAGSVFGLGNDMAGSIRNPAFCCGIFGHKPTKNIVSNRGQFPCSRYYELEQYKSTGPMCRFAADLLPVLKVLAADNASKLNLDKQVNMKSLKIYYSEDYFESFSGIHMDAEVVLAVRMVADQISRSFGIPCKRISVPAMYNSWPIFGSKLTEAKGGKKLANAPSNEKEEDFNIWLELLKWVIGRSDHTFYLLFGELCSTLGATTWYKKTQQDNLKKFEEMARDFQELLGSDGVLISPTRANVAPYHEDQLLYPGLPFCSIFNLLGFPVTQCPTGMSGRNLPDGRVRGLPVGVQVVSNLYNDRLTLAVAKEIEVIFGGWISPGKIL